MERREQILDSAYNAFISRGIKDVKMEDIAADLKISKKTLYEFFSGKKDLLRQSLEYKFPKLIEKMSKIERCMPNPLTALIFSAVESIRFMSSLSDVFLEEVKGVEELAGFSRSVKAQLDDISQKLLEGCVKGGYLNQEDSGRLVSVFMDNARNFEQFRQVEVFPSQLCFSLVITILSGLCTQKGRKVLDELKENYS